MTIEALNGLPLEAPNRLGLLAEEMPNKCMDVAALDQPIKLTQENRSELPPLSGESREKLSEKGFPPAILDDIGSEAEAGIYEEADLQPVEINGKDVLIRTDIDYDQKDIDGKTNLERMKEGSSPLDANNKPIELHHIGQNQDSPLAELTRKEHTGNGNDNILHNKLDESKINREDFINERREHWKARAEQIESQRI